MSVSFKAMPAPIQPAMAVTPKAPFKVMPAPIQQAMAVTPKQPVKSVAPMFGKPVQVIQPQPQPQLLQQKPLSQEQQFSQMRYKVCVSTVASLVNITRKDSNANLERMIKGEKFPANEKIVKFLIPLPSGGKAIFVYRPEVLHKTYVSPTLGEQIDKLDGIQKFIYSSILNDAITAIRKETPTFAEQIALIEGVEEDKFFESKLLHSMALHATKEVMKRLK
jgi:hypothetical protein